MYLSFEYPKPRPNAKSPFLFSEKSFIKEIENNLGIKAKKELLPIQPGDVPATFSDCTSLESFINYKPNTSIEEGIRKFITWYKEFYGK